MTGIQGSVVGRQTWLHIFSRIFVQWSERDMYDYLDLFAEINKKVSHYNEDSIGIDQQGIVYSFVIKSIEFLKRINDAYVRLFSKECFNFMARISVSGSESIRGTVLDPVFPPVILASA